MVHDVQVHTVPRLAVVLVVPVEYPLVAYDAVVGIGDVAPLGGVVAEVGRLEGQVSILTEDVEVLIGGLA